MKTVRTETQNIDVGYLGERVIFNAIGIDTMAFQLTMLDSAIGGAALTVRVSQDGITFVNHPTSTTLSGDGVTALVLTFGYRYLALEVTTVKGSSAYASITAYGEGGLAMTAPTLSV